MNLNNFMTNKTSHFGNSTQYNTRRTLQSTKTSNRENIDVSRICRDIKELSMNGYDIDEVSCQIKELEGKLHKSQDLLATQKIHQRSVRENTLQILAKTQSVLKTEKRILENKESENRRLKNELKNATMTEEYLIAQKNKINEKYGVVYLNLNNLQQESNLLKEEINLRNLEKVNVENNISNLEKTISKHMEEIKKYKNCINTNEIQINHYNKILSEVENEQQTLDFQIKSELDNNLENENVFEEQKLCLNSLQLELKTIKNENTQLTEDTKKVVLKTDKVDSKIKELGDSNQKLLQNIIEKEKSINQLQEELKNIEAVSSSIYLNQLNRIQENEKIKNKVEVSRQVAELMLLDLKNFNTIEQQIYETLYK